MTYVIGDIHGDLILLLKYLSRIYYDNNKFKLLEFVIDKPILTVKASNKLKYYEKYFDINGELKIFLDEKEISIDKFINNINNKIIFLGDIFYSNDLLFNLKHKTLERYQNIICFLLQKLKATYLFGNHDIKDLMTTTDDIRSFIYHNFKFYDFFEENNVKYLCSHFSFSKDKNNKELSKVLKDDDMKKFNNFLNIYQNRLIDEYYFSGIYANLVFIPPVERFFIKYINANSDNKYEKNRINNDEDIYVKLKKFVKHNKMKINIDVKNENEIEKKNIEIHWKPVKTNIIFDTLIFNYVNDERFRQLKIDEIDKYCKIVKDQLKDIKNISVEEIKILWESIFIFETLYEGYVFTMFNEFNKVEKNEDIVYVIGHKLNNKLKSDLIKDKYLYFYKEDFNKDIVKNGNIIDNVVQLDFKCSKFDRHAGEFVINENDSEIAYVKIDKETKYYFN